MPCDPGVVAVTPMFHIDTPVAPHACPMAGKPLEMPGRLSDGVSLTRWSVDAPITIAGIASPLRNGGHGMTSIGAISPASYLAATTATQGSVTQGSATQGSATQGVRHHHHQQASAADPDGDGDPAATATTSASASPAAALTQALNTTA